MEEEVRRYLGRRVVMTYVDKAGRFTQREVVFQSIRNGRIHALDFVKQAPRVFLTAGILAVMPARRAV